MKKILLPLLLISIFTQTNAKNPPTLPGNHSPLSTVTASFTPSATTICSTDTLFLTNTSTNASTYEWWIDGALHSISQNTFWIPPQAGISFVELVAFGTNCSDTTTMGFTINPIPIVTGGPDISMCPDPAPCQIISATITNAPGPYSYQWSPGAGLNSSIILNPCARPDTTTVYTLTATSLLSGCSSQPDTASTVTVIVHPLPIADAGPDKNLCTGDTITLNGIGYGAGPQYFYQWSPSIGLSDPNIANPQAYPSQTTNYTLTVFSNGCISFADTVTVNVLPQTGPMAAFTASQIGGQVYQFQDQSSGSPSSWFWELTCNSNPMPIVNTNANWSDTLPPCEYQVCLTVTNQMGCDDRHCDSISVILGLDNELGRHFTLFPNPVNDHLSIEWEPEMQGKLTYRIRDLQGKLILSREVIAQQARSLDIDLRQLKSGAYLLEVENEGKRAVQRILKVH